MLARFLERLCQGIPDDEIRHPIEPMSLPLYGVLAALALAAALAIFATGFTFALPYGAFVALAVFLLGAMVLRRYGHERIGGAIEASALYVLISMAGMVASILLAGTRLPYVDRALIVADSLLGFDWIALNERFRQSGLVRLAAEIYLSLNWQPFLLLGVLFLAGRMQSGWRFLYRWTLCLGLTLLMFPFFPALAAFDYLGVSPVLHDPTRLGDRSAYVEVLTRARAAGEYAISERSLVGLITFPSFHSAAAVLLAHGFRELVLLRHPFLLLNVAMALSAIFVGGHYLVDILGGVAIALVSILLVDAKPASRA